MWKWIRNLIFKRKEIEKALKEVKDVMTAYKTAKADDHISKEEIKKILDELFEAANALTDLL